MIPINYRLTEALIRYQLIKRGWLLHPSKGDNVVTVICEDRTASALDADLLRVRTPQVLDVVHWLGGADIFILSKPDLFTDAARPAAGRLIAIEGMDGVGKTSVARALEMRLGKEHGLNVRYTSAISDGSTRFGGMVGGALRAEAPSPRAEQAAIIAARIDQWDAIIMPALTAGVWVITDRHDLSGYIYRRRGQCVTQWTHACAAYDIDIPADVTFVIDLPPDHPRRTAALRPVHNRLEAREPEFWERARGEYLDAVIASERVVGFYGQDGSPDELAEGMIEQMRAWLPPDGSA